MSERNERINHLIDECYDRGFLDVGVLLEKQTLMRCNIFKVNQRYKNNVMQGKIVVVGVEQLKNFYEEKELEEILEQINLGKIVRCSDELLEHCKVTVKTDPFYRDKFTWFNTSCTDVTYDLVTYISNSPVHTNW